MSSRHRAAAVGAVVALVVAAVATGPAAIALPDPGRHDRRGGVTILGYSMPLVTIGGAAVHGQAATSAQNIELNPDGFQLDAAFVTCDAVSGPDPTGTVTVFGFSSPLIADVLGAFDASIPNQPPIDLGAEGRVFVNEQSTSIVGGYEILHVTALRFETPTATYTFGEAACGRAVTGPASGGGAAGSCTTMPPTGSEVSGGLAVAGVLALALGIHLVVRRRRVKPSAGGTPPA